MESGHLLLQLNRRPVLDTGLGFLRPNTEEEKPSPGSSPRRRVFGAGCWGHVGCFGVGSGHLLLQPNRRPVLDTGLGFLLPDTEVEKPSPG